MPSSDQEECSDSAIAKIGDEEIQIDAGSAMFGKIDGFDTSELYGLSFIPFIFMQRCFWNQ